MKTFFFLYSIFFFHHSAPAQQIITKDEHINIKAKMFDDSYSRLYSFNIDVYRSEKRTKVVYSVLDSITAKNMFNVWMVYGDTAHAPARFFLNIDSIATTKNLYQKDSIVFKREDNPEYSSLIDSCFLPDASQFDRKLSEGIVNIGSVFYLFIFEKNNKPVNVLSVVSPTQLDHPFLARLATETFSLYKQTNRRLLNKANTNGRYHN